MGLKFISLKKFKQRFSDRLKSLFRKKKKKFWLLPFKATLACEIVDMVFMNNINI